MNKVNLAEKLALISDHWSPKVVGELSSSGTTTSYEREDELFLVLRGAMAIHFRDRVVELAEGEFCIVPRGVEHKPVAAREACVLLLEPASTLNTGDVREARRREELERI